MTEIAQQFFRINVFANDGIAGTPDANSSDALNEFYESIGKSKKREEKLLKNTDSCDKVAMVLNSLVLKYRFKKESAKQKCPEGKKYSPCLIFSFGDLTKLLKQNFRCLPNLLPNKLSVSLN